MSLDGRDLCDARAVLNGCLCDRRALLHQAVVVVARPTGSGHCKRNTIWWVGVEEEAGDCLDVREGRIADFTADEQNLRGLS